MALSTAQNTITYTGNGITTSFAFPYLFYSENDLKVYISGTLVTSGYSVTGVSNPSGGTVVFSVAPINGASIVIERKVDLLQETDFENFDGNPADVTEKQFDLVVMQSQQISAEVIRSAKIPVALGGTYNVSLPIPTDGAYLSWDGATGAIVNRAFGDISTNIDTIFTSLTSGDYLQYDGTNWVNVALTLPADVSTTNITALTSAGGVLKSSGSNACMSWGAGGSANVTLGGNMSGASTHKLVNMIDPSNAQDYATKAYVDARSRNFIDGFKLSPAGSSATMPIGAGSCADSTNAAYITLASAIEKTTSAWSVGDTNGGLDTGTIANNTWYYFYAIRRPDTGVVDVLFSTNATSPTLPTNYTQFRYIGAGRTNGSAQWLEFRQRGDYYTWKDANLQSSFAIGTTRTLCTAFAPINTTALLSISVGSGSAATTIIQPIYETDVAPSVGVRGQINSYPSLFNGGDFEVELDDSSQFAMRSTVAVSGSVVTRGWVDRRGKE